MRVKGRSLSWGVALSMAHGTGGPVRGRSIRKVSCRSVFNLTVSCLVSHNGFLSTPNRSRKSPEHQWPVYWVTAFCRSTQG